MLSRQAELECTCETLSVEVQKLQVLLDDLTMDYVVPLRLAAEHRDYERVRHLALCQSSRADILCSLCSDVVDGMRGYLGEVLTQDDETNNGIHATERGGRGAGGQAAKGAC